MYVCFLNFSSTDNRTVNVRAFDTPVFYNLAPRAIKYRVSVPIPTDDPTIAESFYETGAIWVPNIWWDA